MGAVLEQLKGLRDGKVTLGQVVEDFRSRDWDTTAEATPADPTEAWRQQLADPDVPEGDLADVALAYYSGIITDDQYATLYNVIHGASTAADNPEGADAES